MAVSILLAIILPASLIAGSFATADTAANEPSAADTAAPAALGGTGGGGRQTPRVAKQNSGISPSDATSPATPPIFQSPLTTPSPLNTTSPLIPAQNKPTTAPTPSNPDKAADSLPQTRAAYTVAFNDPAGNTSTPSQSVASGGQASRPEDPARDGYLFDGWFVKDANGDPKVAYDFTQPVTGSITLTARWTKITSSWSLKPTSGPAEGGTRITLTTPTTPDIRFSHIETGTYASLAMGSDGNLYSWGNNSSGELGRDTSTTPADRPGIVTPPTGVRFTQAIAGNFRFLAMGSDGNLYSWGANSSGELGRDTSTTPADRPGKVSLPEGVRFTQVSSGSSHTLAIGSDGNLYSWGEDYDDQLGRDTSSGTPADRPGKVPLPEGVAKYTQASAGTFCSLAIGSDGNLYSWGRNAFGQKGRDTGCEDIKPGQVNLPAGVRKFTQVISGEWSSMAFGSDGNLYSWGRNEKGELGRNTFPDTKDETPGKVPQPAGVTKYTQVWAGDFHSMALGSDGNLYSWGSNNNGQLGNGNVDDNSHAKPVKVLQSADGISKFTQISAGGDSSLGIGANGELYSWGDNEAGQLGNSTTSASPATKPSIVAFPESPRPTDISFGGTAGTGLVDNKDGTWSITTPKHAGGKTDVTISWGMNGQRPDAYLTYRYFGTYNIAFSSDGGSCPAPSGMPNDQSATEGEQAKRPYPDPQSAGCQFDGWFLKDANGDSRIAYDFSQPVTGSITLVAHWSPADNGTWSINPDKGNVLGGQQVTITPPKASRGIRFNQISAGGSQNREMRGFSVGVASDGNAYAWGNNRYGQLGTGDNKQQDKPTEVLKPDSVKEDFTYTQISAGGAHTLAIGSDGILYSWGHNDFGQLGNGSTDTSVHPKPIAVINPSTGQPFQAVQVSAGACDSVAIDTTGKVYSWGSETTTLGDNVNTANSDSKTKPTLVADPGGTDQGLHAVQVSANWSFIMALNADGNIYAWGYNNWGQFGNGSSTNGTWTTYSSTPTLVRDPTDTSKGLQVTRISAGAWHALAIGQDGTVWAWGMNNNGQLGFSTDQTSSKQVTLPKQVPNLKAQQVSASTWNSLAIGLDGTAWGWGNNANGQLGDGTTSKRATPRPVLAPADQSGSGTGFASVRISAGWGHSVAIGQDGKAYAWGDNRYNQLGAEQSLTQSRTPTLVAFNPMLLITGVKFDKTVVNPLQQNSDGSVSFATPVHNPGLADVVVDWTLDDISQTQAHLAYTYEGVLPLTGGDGTMILLLAAGLLAAAGAVAAGRHRRETRALQA